MSYEDGLAALNLEMPKRIPRTEYSAHQHWDLVESVTGIAIDANSSDAIKTSASNMFVQLWNYDIFWSVGIQKEIFGKMCSTMGHAVYSTGGEDFQEEVSCPFTDVAQVLRFDPWTVYGTKNEGDIKLRFEKHYHDNCENYPNLVNMTGIYVTCISGLIDIFGWEMLLLALGTDSVGFGKVVERYTSWIQQYFNALAEADVPVVMVHDDIVWTSGPFVKPDWYREYVFPCYQKLFAPLIESSKKILFTSDGDYTLFIDDIVKTGVHGFVLEPVADMNYIAQKYGQTHVFVGNGDTRILLSGGKKEIYTEVERCIAIGKKCPGFFMAIGNHIPANTPVENALYYNEIYDELSQR